MTLSLAEYNRLLELAAKKPKPPEIAPLPYILSRAAYKLRLENEALAGSLEMSGEVLRKGPTKVPLATGLSILDARQDQRPLPLLREGASHAAIIDGPKAFTFSLDVAAAVAVEAGRASISLPVPNAGSALLTLDIPGNHADVHAEPGLITERLTSGGRTQTEATLQPGKPVTIWWTTRESSGPVAQREVRFLSDMKTVISVGDSGVRLAALCDITVIQGEPAEFTLPLPSGYEVSEASGSTLESSEILSGKLILKVRQPAARSHQFLVAIERENRANKLEAPVLAIENAQRETGEVLVEGSGTIELAAKEDGGLRRIDVREAGAVARSLARFPVQAAFRYHRRPGDSPRLSLEWDEFPDSSVLAAIAERATVTTLLNIEGKSLTEVTLRVRNHAQPFMKVELPQGASLLSAEVEGERVKPVVGSDGIRVPLLRIGFRPSGVYTVSFVYLSAGPPFAKNGSYEMTIPKLDVPVSLVNWEVFMPDRLEVKQFGGNALAAALLPPNIQDALLNDKVDQSELDFGPRTEYRVEIANLQPNQMGGVVVDPSGAALAGASVTVVNTQNYETRATRTDSQGRWLLAGMRSGPVRLTVEMSGFKSHHEEMNYDASRPPRLGTSLEVGAVSETVTVVNSSTLVLNSDLRAIEQERKARQEQLNAPSQNVFGLQRRVAGVLPIRIDVPHTGKSYRFVRPLVLEEDTKITFRYKSK